MSTPHQRVVRALRVEADMRSRSWGVERNRDDADVGKRWGVALHDWRVSRGLTLKEASERLAPCSIAHLSDMERGERLPRLPLLFRMSEVYGVAFMTLVHGLLAVQAAREARDAS